MNNLDMDEQDDIYLEEEVEVNKTPGSPQMGGALDFTTDAFTKYFLEHSAKLIDSVSTGFALDDKGGQVTPKSVQKDIKENLTIYISPLAFYFQPNGQVYDTYDNYIASIPTSNVTSIFSFSRNKTVKVAANIFDKIIYDLLFFTQKEKTAQNWENVKAFISMISRLYVLFIHIFFKPDLDAVKSIRDNTSPFLRKNYDLFNALEILTALGFFGSSGIVSDVANGQFTIDLTITNGLNPVKDAAINEINNATKYPPGGAKNPQFNIAGMRNRDLYTIFKAILIKDPQVNPAANQVYTYKEMNFTYYLLEYVYQNISTLLYTIFKVYDNDGQNEVKTYNEFRTTAEFLKSMPAIIDQAFKTQAVATARAQPQSAVQTADNIVKLMFDLLKSGTTQADLTGANPDPVKQAKFNTIVGTLDTNKATIVAADAVTLKEAGFDKAAFTKIEAKVTPTAANPQAQQAAAAAAVTFSELTTILTSKIIFDKIKELASLYKTQKAEYRKAPGPTTRFRDAKDAIANINIANNPNASFQDKLAAAPQADRTTYENTKRIYDPIERDVKNLPNEIFNIISTMGKYRLKESPFSDNIRYRIFQPIVEFVEPNFQVEIAAIDGARNQILNYDVTTNDEANPAPADNNVADLVAMNTRLQLYINDPAIPAAAQGAVRQTPKDLIENLINAYQAYKARFDAAQSVKNDEMVKKIDDVIATFKTTAPLDQKVTQLDITPPGQPALNNDAKKTLLRTKITEAKDQFIALKRLLTDAIPANAQPAQIPSGLAAGVAKGTYHDVIKLGSEEIKDPFIESITMSSGGSRRNTRRNRHRRNATTRRNNDMSY